MSRLADQLVTDEFMQRVYTQVGPLGVVQVRALTEMLIEEIGDAVALTSLPGVPAPEARESQYLDMHAAASSDDWRECDDCGVVFDFPTTPSAKRTKDGVFCTAECAGKECSGDVEPPSSEEPPGSTEDA